MIRPAKFVDVPRIVELLTEMHAVSRYKDRVGVNHKVAHNLAAQCIQKHGGTHDGGSLVYVAERDGVVEGVMIGMLDRVYHIGDMLMANDVFLYCSPRAYPMDMPKLFDAYMQWAQENPRVYEIGASWTDVADGAERIEAMYERKGFRKAGAIWKRDVRTQVEGIAA